MNLENIGFYTLENNRAKNTSIDSPLWRCELIITDTCNFQCPYCRGIEKENRGMLSWNKIKFILDAWSSHNLRNVRFSGGEPTLWKDKDKTLVDIIRYAKEVGIDRIAISTNGSNKPEIYQELIDAGANDFSISLDACCAEDGDKMAGEIKGSWKKVVDNIKYCAERTYTTVGVVFTEETIKDFNNIISFASDELKVDDIRIICAAQWNEKFTDVFVDKKYLERHPILNYRITNFKNGIHVRGLKDINTKTCHMMNDDMVILNDNIYKCVIHMREHGKPMYKIDYSLSPKETMDTIRAIRYSAKYSEEHQNDFICNKNCLDVCIEYNDKVEKYKNGNI